MSDSYAASADHPLDDIASVRVDLRDVIHAIGTSDLDDREVGPAIDAIPWRLRDRLAPA